MNDEEDFHDGPNFGGIAISRSLISEGAPPDTPLPGSGPGRRNGQGEVGGRVALPGRGTCDCRCSDVVLPRTRIAVCRAWCEPELARCAPQEESSKACGG